jgi:PAS domain S-box-containing protein
VETLKDSELRYRRLFEAAQDGILILDAETGAITDVNPYLIDMLGYSREEFVEKKLWEVGAFKDIKASQEAFLALQKDEYIRYKDLPLRAKNGRLIQVEFVSNVYSAGAEKVIQCNIRDITERIQAENALVKS